MIPLKESIVFFVAFVAISMLLLHYWIIPTYVPEADREVALHWTLIIGNIILIVYNLFEMSPEGIMSTGNELGHDFKAGKRRR